MPGGFQLGLDLCNATTIGAKTSNSLATQINCGTSGTFGAYTQLIAATAGDASWMIVNVSNALSSGYEEAVNIAVGAAGSEKIIASNLVVSAQPSLISFGCSSYSFPCQIKAGSRISASAQGNGTSDNALVEVILLDGGFSHIEGAAGIDGIGFVSGNGTPISPITPINTKGAYAQITGATARDYIGYLLAADTYGQTTVYQWLFDLAIGAAGAETTILSNFSLVSNNGGIVLPNVIGPIWQSIPAGTRIAARCQGSATPVIAFGLTFYGIYQ